MPGRISSHAFSSPRKPNTKCLPPPTPRLTTSGGRTIGLDAGDLNRRIVLENDLVFGSVNANRRHYVAAADALARADRAWLERLITRRVPLDRWHEALAREPDDIKVVVELGAS